jgi:phage tail sheath protein FI
MPELTLRSPGVSTREIDLSGPRQSTPTGVPAGVIGTSNDGPAFVPVTIGNYSDFAGLFGASDGEKFGPLAVNEWLKNGTSCTYIRVLGAGNGKKRDGSSKKVTNAGFVVGGKRVQANGIVSANPKANADGVPGRTYFLGCFMSESNGSTIFSDAGIQATDGVATATIVVADSGGIIDGDTFTLVDSKRTSTVYTINAGVLPAAGGGSGGSATVGFSGIGGGSAGKTATIASMVIAINATTDANYTAVDDGVDTVTITQGTSGPSGNRTNVDDIDSTTVSNFSGGVGGSVPILRGIILAPSGVALTLSGNHAANSAAPGSSAVASANPGASGMRGSMTGSVVLQTQEFTMLLNGHIGSSAGPRALTASFDYRAPNYIANVLNTDPYEIETHGHYLYTDYAIHPNFAAVTGSGVLIPSASDDYEGRFLDVAYLVTSSEARNTGTSTVPNYESFEERFTTAFSPYVISQDFGGAPKDLFRVEALSDGAAPTTKFKISIENIKKSNSDSDKFGSFDLIVREFNDSDEEQKVLETFRGVDLDPSSARFVARVVGDQKAYFNFDAKSGAQKLVVEGDNPNRSSLIRVKQSTGLKKGELPDESLPMGFRGPYHLNTSGSLLTSAGANALHFEHTSIDYLKACVEVPIPFRETVAYGTGQTKRSAASLYWGVQFSHKESITEPNKVSLFNPMMNSYAKFFPRFEGSALDFSAGNNAGKADTNGTVQDSDRFNNNKFTLERLKVRTGSDTFADPSYWLSASYVRNGVIAIDTDLKTRAFKVDDLKSAGNRNYAKFSFFLQGGFDGTDIFNKDKSKLTNTAAVREMDDSDTQGGNAGSTVGSFRKAIDIMGNTTDVSIKLLAIPGMRETGVTDYAISAVENRFDALYIMDIEERDTLNTIVTSSDQITHVKNTVGDFTNRALDTSFTAAYFPDVIQQDPGTLTNVRVPPSVAVLGAFGLNDAVGHPWFAPAGFSRGALKNAQRASVELKRSNLDDLYDADINPLTDFPGTGLVVFGQKTLLATASALDRVNVRRLLIEVRRSVRSIANTLLFEPNRQTTLDKFNALVNPILQGIQEQNGLDRFKVIIDATTTTQADIENNTIRGKIFLQPTRTIEFIALDFVVTNAGASV